MEEKKNTCVIQLIPHPAPFPQTFIISNFPKQILSSPPPQTPTLRSSPPSPQKPLDPGTCPRCTTLFSTSTYPPYPSSSPPFPTEPSKSPPACLTLVWTSTTASPAATAARRSWSRLSSRRLVSSGCCLREARIPTSMIAGTDNSI